MKNTTKDNEPINNLDKIVSLCKRRGFIFQNSEIYGGLGSIWDYGPLGTQLKRNIKESWWNKMVLERKDIVGLDSSILMNPDIWKASGHLDNFTDPLVECQKCNQRWREDQLNKNCCQYVLEAGHNVPLETPKDFANTLEKVLNSNL